MEARYFAREWIWQGQKVNVLVVLRSPAFQGRVALVDLLLPAGLCLPWAMGLIALAVSLYVGWFDIVKWVKGLFPEYHANFLPAFDTRAEPIALLEGRRADGKVRFVGWGDVSAYRGPDWRGTIEEGRFTGSVPGREGGTFSLGKVVRLSPTLGAKPPAGAAVLFDGTVFDAWQSHGGKEPVTWTIADGARLQQHGSAIAYRNVWVVETR